MKRIWHYFRLMRPLNLFQGGIAVLVTASLMENFPAWPAVVLTLITVWCFTGGGNSINDYFDAAIDRINRPNRPIPSGNVSQTGALNFSMALFFFGIVAALPAMNMEVAVILAVAMFFLLTYSRVFKVRPLWGNLVVSLILGLCFVYSAALFGDSRKGIVPGLLAFGFNLVREIVKDMEDIEGDEKQGARTFPIQYGMAAAKKLAILLALALICGVFVPSLLNIYSGWYMTVVLVTVIPALFYSIVLLIRDASPKNCGRVAAILKGDIFFGLLAIFLGGF